MATRRRYRRASPTELIYIATGTIVVSRSSIAGAVSREQFDTAVAHLEARYGILRSVVEDGEFVERVDDRSSIEAWLPADAWSADAVYATLVNTGLDTRARIYSIHVIADADALDVFMLSSHAITDATSLIELHSCLAYLCDCVVRGVAPGLPEQPFPTPVDAAVDHSLASLPADRIRNPAAYSGAFAEIPLRAPHDGQPVTHRLEQLVIAPDDVHRISAASHAHGASVHAALLTAFALAIGDVAEGRPRQILMRSSVDMRRRLEPHVSPELVFSAITGHITPIPDLDQPLFDIAKLVFLDIHEGVANGAIFHDYVNYPKAFGNAQQPPVALNISDMQAVKFHWPTERLKVTGFEYALGWLKRFPNVSVSIYDGTLIANTVYVDEFAEPAIMRAISNGVVERLLSASRSG
jgi:phthiocerol/phthiodiolone dimycocerosyl transferase-like enzyme